MRPPFPRASTRASGQLPAPGGPGPRWLPQLRARRRRRSWARRLVPHFAWALAEQVVEAFRRQQHQP
eukprot:461941-Lingulodinium_polyedra.AAC.1